MGLMRKLNFWKKSKSSSNSVQRFEGPRENGPEAEESAGEHEDLDKPPPAVGSPSSAQAASSLKGKQGAAPLSPTPQEAAASEEQLAAAAQAKSPTASGGARRGPPPPPEAEHPAECSPVPPYSAREDALVFGLPPEAVFGKIGEAFGQMVAQSVQSSKWDKRSQALKEVSSVLRGLEMNGRAPPGSIGALGKGLKLRDREACWRGGCLLLNVALKDKVIPIRLSALDLFLDNFAACMVADTPQEELQHALDVLIEHLIDRLGDSNLRLHEGTRKCILFVAEQPGLLGLAPTLAKLRARLGKAGKSGEKAKVHFGILDTVNFLLQHFPGSRGNGHIDEDLDDEEDADAKHSTEDADVKHSTEDSWTQHDIAPFIVAGMDDSLGPRVREIAASLAVTVYQTFGTEAMKPILAELRPAKQALLKQKFEEFEGFDPEEGEGDEEEGVELRPADLQGLVVCGNAIKPVDHLPAPRPAHLPGSVNTDYDEEFIMDGILEDAGLVFSGTGIVGGAVGSVQLQQAQEPAASQRLPPGFLEQQLGLSGLDLDEDDHRFLEEELAHYGMDMEGVDEQEALLLSLQEHQQQHLGRRGVSVEVF